MDSTPIFWMQLLTSLVVFGIVAVWYVWPYLAKLSRNSALIPLLFVHVPRYVGMTLLVTGMIDPKLPSDRNGYRITQGYYLPRLTRIGTNEHRPQWHRRISATFTVAVTPFIATNDHLEAIIAAQALTTGMAGRPR